MTPPAPQPTDAPAGAAAGRAALPLALAAGAATSLAFAPWGLWPLALLGPAVLFWLWGASAPRAAARLGFAWGVGLFAAGTYWLYTAVHEFGGAPAWLAVFLMLALVALMAAYLALLGWTIARFVPDGLARRLCVLPAGWLLLDWLRGWLFTGFPWLGLGNALVDTWLAGLAPVAGVHALTFAAALSAGALAALPLGRRAAAAAVAVLALAWGAGLALDGRAWTQPVGAPLSVALVQGAIPQDLKWQADNRQATLDLYARLTAPALGRDLIVWPEAALPLLEHEARDYLSQAWGRARVAGSALVLGLLRYDFDTQRYYNGMLALGDGEPQWYYKRRLVPFGEFFPVPETVRGWMRLMSLPYVDMTAGPESQPPLRVAGQALGATICYEDAYGAEQLAVLREATLIVNVTNNAWFGDSTAPHQQLQMARLRALEAGRWLARATSNGITAVIAPDGRVAARARQFVPEVLYAEVVPHAGLTPYARTGNSPVLALALLACVAGAAAARRRRH